MKKIMIILALLATGMCASAQVDTLNIGDRAPNYYYWDTNWWDHYYMNYPEARAESIYWYIRVLGASNLQPEYARYCYTDTSLRIVGIAAALKINKQSDTITDIFKHMLPEYFNLYEVDGTTGEMVKLAGKSWNGNSPRFQMVTEMTNSYSILPDTIIPDPPSYSPVYEVYFDSAITVNDSFYVSVTEYNHTKPEPSLVTAGLAAIGAQSFGPFVDGTNVYLHPEFFPKPNHYKRKFHTMPSYADEDHYYFCMDTAWHTYNVKNYNNPNVVMGEHEWPYFMFIFPIIDTTGYYLRYLECNPPSEFGHVYVDSCTLEFTWSDDGSTGHYELAVSRLGQTPEEGIITQWDTCFGTVQVEPWDTTSQWYTAWVRCICANGERSEWSGSVMVGVHCTSGEGPADPEDINTATDFGTRLMPNPASGSVTVASTSHINEVEVYSLAGRSLMLRKAGSQSYTLDISQLPAGTYIVRVATTAGTAYKKLVVK